MGNVSISKKLNSDLSLCLRLCMMGSSYRASVFRWDQGAKKAFAESE